MTNKEYLTKSLNGMNLSDDDIEIIMLKGGIDADAPASVEQCDVAVYNRFFRCAERRDAKRVRGWNVYFVEH